LYLKFIEFIHSNSFFTPRVAISTADLNYKHKHVYTQPQENTQNIEAKQQKQQKYVTAAYTATETAITGKKKVKHWPNYIFYNSIIILKHQTKQLYMYHFKTILRHLLLLMHEGIPYE
jgi:hypothetical protein